MATLSSAAAAAAVACGVHREFTCYTRQHLNVVSKPNLGLI